jgi:hypothetical protein
MSLISFHRLLIFVGIVFCAGYAIWELLHFMGGDGGVRSLLLVVAFSGAALALGYYLRHLGRILHLSGADDHRDSEFGG